MQVEQVKAVLTADINNFVSGFGMASQAAESFQKKTMGLKDIGKMAGVVGKGLTMGLTVPLAGIGAAGVKTAADFQAGMSKVQAISGASAKDMGKLSDMAKKMGATTKFSATESADALSYMAMAGWKTDQMMGGLPGIMNLAAASGEDLALTSDIVTDALTGFGLKAKDSAMFADVLAAASSNANTDVAMMGETFKYAAPLAGTLGYNVQDTAVAIGLMANAGIKGSQAGTTLRSAFSRLASPTAEVTKGMEMLGLKIEDVQGLSLDETLRVFRNSFKELDSTQQAQAASMIFGKQAMSGMLAVINASEDEYNNLQDAIYNSSGAAEKMAKIMQDNLKGSVTQMKSALEGMAITIGERLAPKIRKLVDFITRLASGFNQLSPSVQDAIVNFGLLLASVGPALLIFSKLVKTFTAVKASIAPLGAALKGFNAVLMGTASPVGMFGTALLKAKSYMGMFATALAGIGVPVGVFIAAIAAMGLALFSLWQNNEQFRTNIIAIWTNIKETLSNLIAGISERFAALGVSFATLKDTVIPIWQAFCNMLAPIFEGAFRLVAVAFQTIADLILGFLDIFIGVFTGNWEQAWNGVKTITSTILKAISTTVKTVLETIKNVIKAAWEFVKTTTTSVWEAIQTLIKSKLDSIKNSVQQVFEAIKNVVEKVWNAIKSTTESVWSAIKSKVESTLKAMTSALTSAFEQMNSKATSVMESIKQTITNKFNEAKNSATTAVNNIKTAVSQAFSNMLSTIKSKMSGVVSAVKSGFSRAMSAARSATSGAVSVGANMVAGFVRGVMSKAASLARAAANVVKRAINAAKSAAGIHSPSRVFKEIGQYLIEGGVVGVNKEAPNFIKTVGGVAKDVIDAFGQPTLDVATSMNRINGVNGQVDHLVQSNISDKRPAYINLNLGGRSFRAFVEDISNTQGQEAHLEEVYSI